MKRAVRRSAGALATYACAAILAAPSPADAQIDAQTFRPLADGRGWVSVPDSSTLPAGVLWLGLSMNYAVDPVRADLEGGEIDVTTDLFTTDWLAAFGIVEGWEVTLGLPVSTIRNVAFAEELDEFVFGVGDLAVGTKVALLDPGESGLGLAALGRFTAPTGDEASFLGAEGITLGADLAAELPLGPLTFAGTVGYLFRDEDAGLDDALALSAALAWDGEGARFQPVAEIHATSELESLFERAESSPVEALVGFRWEIPFPALVERGTTTRGVVVASGAGFGLNDGIGSPSVRGVLTVAPLIGGAAPAARPARPTSPPAAPPVDAPPDSDRDGIPDARDVCPTRPETPNGQTDRDGCPD